MKYLQRPPLDAAVQKAFAACIKHHWLWDKAGGFSQRFPAEKMILKNQLLGMQSFCCAYCGAKLTTKEQFGFIEHFERREGKIRTTYDWSNLFVSCKSCESCGIWKDMEGKHIPLSQVLKPDERSVIGRFKYLPDGRVASTEEEDAEVEATIEVFNLNTPQVGVTAKKIDRRPRKCAPGLCCRADGRRVGGVVLRRNRIRRLCNVVASSVAISKRSK